MTKKSISVAIAGAFLGALAACGGSNGTNAADTSGRPMLTGAEIFAHNCSYCHSPGADHPGTRQLGDTRGKELAILENRTDLQPEYIETIVRHGINAMPPFKPTVITDDELAKLAKYLSKSGK